MIDFLYKSPFVCISVLRRDGISSFDPVVGVTHQDSSGLMVPPFTETLNCIHFLHLHTDVTDWFVPQTNYKW